MSQLQIYFGVDWGASSSHVCVVDSDGKRAGQAKVRTALDLLDFVRTHASGMAPAQIGVAFERADTPLVDSCTEMGFAVFTINPKVVDRFRDRWSMAGAKDDRRDALVLASTLRTDAQAFRRHHEPSEAEVLLRALHGSREQAKRRRREAANQLWSTVARVYPTLVALCSSADRHWFLDVVELLTDADRPDDIDPNSFAAILKRRRVRKHSADDVLTCLRESHPSPARLEAFRRTAKPLLEQVRLSKTQEAEAERELEQQLARLRAAEGKPDSDVDLMLSMPGFGAVTTAGFVIAMPQALEGRDLQRLRVLTGTAPVTRASGRTKSVTMRRACSGVAQQAMFHVTSKAIQRDERFRALYDAARARGCGHARALRTVADSVLRVLVAMLKNRTRYDPRRYAKAEKPLGLDTVEPTSTRKPARSAESARRGRRELATAGVASAT